ncbi:Bgt-20094 [Blumeria graminis f. sp. tritici]|uniref:Bgt-20094 n=1 Tax=Blumeria graminis f. sp. tritici TaxID=62690 RepID=A0A9X9MPN9_BLUGR|nr:Bgt-20094 [Blumeria graminis f. sp. tritici]
MDAKILHRDNSVNNLLLTVIQKTDKLGVILIDLNFFILLREGKDQEKSRAMTGTMQSRLSISEGLDF